MKHKLIIVILVSAALIFFSIVIAKQIKEYDDYYRDANWEEDFYGKETYAELKKACSAEDLEALQPVLDLAEEAFSCVDTDQDEAKERFGKLYIYTYYYNGSVCSEFHVLDFITAKLDGDSGYMWIQYVKRGYDETGECITGSGGIGGHEVKSRWTLERIDNEWVVTGILEHP